MTERSRKAMSTEVTYDKPVSATKHDGTTPDSHDKIHLGANRQANGLEYGQGRVTNNQTMTGKTKDETAAIIPEAADANGQTQEPETSSSETVTTKTAGNKPLITIPSMSRLNSQSTSAAQTPSSTTSSRRSSKHVTSNIPSLTPTRPAPPSPVSQPPSRRGSRTLSSAQSTASSTHSTQRSPSHRNSTSSLYKAGLNDGSRPNVVRRQSSLAITYTAFTPVPKTGMGSIDAGKDDGPGRAEPVLVNGASSTSSPPISEVEPDSAASVARKILDPLSAMNPPKPDSTANTTTNSDTPLRRNFSSTSASTSGASTTSSSSNPVLRHATELELAYGVIPSNSTATADAPLSNRISRSGSAVSATQASQFSTRPRSIIQSLWGNRMRNAETEGEGDNSSPVDADGEADAAGFAELNPHDSVSNIPPPKHPDEEECADIAWALSHSVIVRDFGFEEGDELFDRVPPEALLAVLRPPKEDSEGRSVASERGKVPGMGMGVAGGMRRGVVRGRSNGLPGSDAHYGGGAHYGGRWGAGEDDFEEDEDLDDEYDDEEEEEDDGWGFPMGTVSGGPAPLGTTLLGGKRSRRELKNRVRAWNGLGGSKGVGGRWVSEETSEAEGESSGFYEEGEGVSGGEGISGDDDHDGEDVDPKDGDDAGLELDAFALMHTPSKAYLSFIGDEEHVSGRVEPPTYTPRSACIPGSQLAYAAYPGHMDVDGVDADNDEDGDDSTDYDDIDRDHGAEEVVKPGMYRAIFPFQAEGPAEMSVLEGRMVRVVGRGGDGWVIVERTTPLDGVAITGASAGASLGVGVDELGEEHGLVPLGYLQAFKLDDVDGDGAL